MRERNKGIEERPREVREEGTGGSIEGNLRKRVKCRSKRAKRGEVAIETREEGGKGRGKRRKEEGGGSM